VPAEAFQTRIAVLETTRIDERRLGHSADLGSLDRSLPAFAEPASTMQPPDPEFRRCDACGQRNIVKDDDFTCAICGGELPATWNFTS
jgi:hypothetical protein